MKDNPGLVLVQPAYPGVEYRRFRSLAAFLLCQVKGARGFLNVRREADDQRDSQEVQGADEPQSGGGAADAKTTAGHVAQSTVDCGVSVHHRRRRTSPADIPSACPAG